MAETSLKNTVARVIASLFFRGKFRKKISKLEFFGKIVSMKIP